MPTDDLEGGTSRLTDGVIWQDNENYSQISEPASTTVASQFFDLLP